MADDERPAWRQLFDTVEAAVAPALEQVMRSEQFAVALGIATQAQKAVQERAERTMRRTLHLWNLPAGSDVTRILNEIGKLQREVRELSRQVDASTKEVSSGAGGSPRPRAAGR
ncbi:MAG TPA: poly(R)-hydroxyalkanoic acid synthase subunit PhaE [Acidimicrobiales bacterium]|nr:poly(R)-hydroxyalkanoic acid synthase subunit PhaE [Acidimicrobiales bacterium]